MLNLKHELESIFPCKKIGSISSCLSATKNGKYDYLISLIKYETRFLDKHNIDVSISERIYCIMNNIIKSLKCNNEKCNNEITKYRGPKFGYNEHCSNKCSRDDINVDKKRKQTCNEKYGVEFSFQSKNHKEKTKQTCIDKYGVEFSSQSNEVKEKTKQTCIGKYGADNPFQAEEIKNKSKITCIGKYGSEYYCKSTFFKDRNEEIKNKKDKTCMERYGINSEDIPTFFQEKSKQTCIERYGVEFSFQSENNKNKTKKYYNDNYGVNHYSQLGFKKCGYKWYNYITPSGIESYIQGYENLYLDGYFNSGGLESNILIGSKEIESYIGIIWYYTIDGKKCRYFPDFYLIKENKIIEVKSTYTIKCNVEINELKRQACLRMGLKFEYRVYDKNKKLIGNY